MKWFKTDNKLTVNTKLALVATKTKAYKHEVIAAWMHLLCMAAHEENHGDLGNVEFEEIDLALEFTPGRTEKIYKAFEDRKMIAGGKIINWKKHQADPTNAERQRRHRDKNKVSNGNVTDSNDVTVEERRREEKRGEEKGGKENIPLFISEDRFCRDIKARIKAGEYVSNEDKKIVSDFEAKIKAKIKAGVTNAR